MENIVFHMKVTINLALDMTASHMRLRDSVQLQDSVVILEGHNAQWDNFHSQNTRIINKLWGAQTASTIRFPQPKHMMRKFLVQTLSTFWTLDFFSFLLISFLVQSCGWILGNCLSIINELVVYAFDISNFRLNILIKISYDLYKSQI